MNKITLEFQELPYAVAEAMNRLRINIKFCGKSTRKILITSSLPGEGKSTVSTNLWKLLAEAGFPTVLVDADLRKSELQDRLKLTGEGEIKGLDYYVSGLAEYEDVVYKTNVENAYMVPCTNLLENPSALLEDARFRELLDRLAKEYRYVIIDSAPLGSVADGVLVASMCDGAALVVRCRETPRSLIHQSIQQLEQAECSLLGVILNRIESSGRTYRKYYGDYGYYKKYYSSDRAKKSLRKEESSTS